MCRSHPALLLLLLLLTAAAGNARVHVQSSPADIGPPAGQGAEEGGPAGFKDYQLLKVYVAGNSTLDLLRRYEDNPGKWYTGRNSRHPDLVRRHVSLCRYQCVPLGRPAEVTNSSRRSTLNFQVSVLVRMAPETRCRHLTAEHVLRTRHKHGTK